MTPARPDLRYFVCDRCAFLWQARRASKCGACGHRALWEFPAGRGQAAMTHSWHIRNPERSVVPL